jgi:hypothetical protein
MDEKEFRYALGSSRDGHTHMTVAVRQVETVFEITGPNGIEYIYVGNDKMGSVIPAVTEALDSFSVADMIEEALRHDEFPDKVLDKLLSMSTPKWFNMYGGYLVLGRDIWPTRLTIVEPSHRSHVFVLNDGKWSREE